MGGRQRVELALLFPGQQTAERRGEIDPGQMAAARTVQQIGREPVFKLREQRRITDVGPRRSGDAPQKRNALAPASQAVGPWQRIEAKRPYAGEQRGGDRSRIGRGERRIGVFFFVVLLLASCLLAFAL